MASWRYFDFYIPRLKPLYFITGTDTAVGKTVLACLLVTYLRARGVNAAALKPVSSGGRNDARDILAAMNGALALDDINPWHFRAPVAPLLAARRENKKIKPAPVLAHIRSMQKRFDVLLVEGAGGLLSPMGDGFDSRHLILGLRARPLIVAPDKLGTVNAVLLTLEALPKDFRRAAKVVLMPALEQDASSATNAALLAEFFPAKKIFSLPRFHRKLSAAAKARAAITLAALLEA